MSETKTDLKVAKKVKTGKVVSTIKQKKDKVDIKKGFIFKLFVTFCAGCNFGSTTSNLTTPIMQFYAAQCAKYGRGYDAFNATIVGSLSVGVLVGGCIGSMALTYIMARFGRKIPTIICGFAAFICNILICFPVHWVYLLSMRIVLGIFSASLTTIIPTWMGDITNDTERSYITGAMQSFTNFGLVCSAVLLFIIGENGKLYPLSFTVAAACSLFCAIFAFTLKEKNDEAENNGKEKSKSKSVKPVIEKSWKEFFGPKYRKVVALAFLLNIAEQFSGINAVIMYATVTFQKAFTSEEVTETYSSIYGTLIIMGMNLLSGFCVLFVINHLGRKTLWNFGSVLCLAGLLLFIAAYFMKYENGVQGEPNFEFLVAASIIFIFGFQVGPGPVFFVLASELFPDEVKSKCSGVTFTVNWVSNIILVFIFPFFKGFPWMFYTVVFLVMGSATMILFVLLPETKGLKKEKIKALVLIQGSGAFTSKGKSSKKTAKSKKPTTKTEKLEQKNDLVEAQEVEAVETKETTQDQDKLNSQ